MINIKVNYFFPLFSKNSYKPIMKPLNFREHKRTKRTVTSSSPSIVVCVCVRERELKAGKGGQDREGKVKVSLTPRNFNFYLCVYGILGKRVRLILEPRMFVV